MAQRLQECVARACIGRQGQKAQLRQSGTAVTLRRPPALRRSQGLLSAGRVFEQGSISVPCILLHVAPYQALNIEGSQSAFAGVNLALAGPQGHVSLCGCCIDMS